MQAYITILASFLNLFTAVAKLQNGGLCVPNILPGTHGKVDGFKCSRLEAENSLFKAGIRDNDLILSVDNERITGPEQMQMLFKKLDGHTYSKILIVHDGKELVLNPPAK